MGSNPDNGMRSTRHCCNAAMIWKPSVVVIVERDGRFLLGEEQADGLVVLNQPAGHLDNPDAARASISLRLQP